MPTVAPRLVLVLLVARCASTPSAENRPAPPRPAPPLAAPSLPAPALPAAAPPTAAPPTAARVTLRVSSKTAPVYASPTTRAERIGYLRLGASVAAEGGTVPGHGCAGGWFALVAGGFACARRDVEPDAVAARRHHRLPAAVRDAPMPLAYARVLRPTALLRHLPGAGAANAEEPARADGETAPRETLETLAGEPGSLMLRRLTRGMYLALDRVVRRRARPAYWRTQTGGYVAARAVTTVEPRPWGGVALADPARLPLAFAVGDDVQRYRETAAGLVPEGRIPRLTAVALAADAPLVVRGERYFRAAEGFLLRGRRARVVTASPPPPGLAPGERWIDVNLDQQSLVAYEGDRPVFATLVSTGLPRHGTGAVETVRGDFRIEAKHRTVTMDGDTPEGVYSVEDVPWVMYFHGSFALHGAFWHDDFGRPHSHGCVNLSPTDARWLFGWTEPRLPAGWHGIVAAADRPGTRVIVHDDRRGTAERAPAGRR